MQFEAVLFIGVYGRIGFVGLQNAYSPPARRGKEKNGAPKIPKDPRGFTADRGVGHAHDLAKEKTRQKNVARQKKLNRDDGLGR